MCANVFLSDKGKFLSNPSGMSICLRIIGSDPAVTSMWLTGVMCWIWGPVAAYPYLLNNFLALGENFEVEVRNPW